jgi:hypothetical protein
MGARFHSRPDLPAQTKSVVPYVINLKPHAPLTNHRPRGLFAVCPLGDFPRVASSPFPTHLLLAHDRDPSPRRPPRGGALDPGARRSPPTTAEMKNLFKSKIRWQHRSNDPAPPSGQQPQPQGQPSASPATSPSGAASALSTSTGPSSSSSVAAATPAGPTVAAGAGGAGGEDYMLSEEEFQMQLAMALSASNSESVGDLDGEQIRKAKLMSLDRHGAHRDEGHTAESLSRRYWVSHLFQINML